MARIRQYASELGCYLYEPNEPPLEGQSFNKQINNATSNIVNSIRSLSDYVTKRSKPTMSQQQAVRSKNLPDVVNGPLSNYSVYKINNNELRVLVSKVLPSRYKMVETLKVDDVMRYNDTSIILSNVSGSHEESMSTFNTNNASVVIIPYIKKNALWESIVFVVPHNIQNPSTYNLIWIGLTVVIYYYDHIFNTVFITWSGEFVSQLIDDVLNRIPSTPGKIVIYMLPQKSDERGITFLQINKFTNMDNVIFWKNIV
jgi:hypothetical protein